MTLKLSNFCQSTRVCTNISRLTDSGFPLTCRIHGVNNIHQQEDQTGMDPQTQTGTTDPYLVNPMCGAEEKSPTYRSALHDMAQCSAEVGCTNNNKPEKTHLSPYFSRKINAISIKLYAWRIMSYIK